MHIRSTTTRKRRPSAWVRVSAELTAFARTASTRRGITVTAAPGLGQGAPGCFIPGRGLIELDAEECFPGLDPASINARQPRDHTNYPAAIGVLHHELAHADHSAWFTDRSHAPGLVLRAAVMLEEVRCEHRRLSARPGDRAWLRAAVSTLVIPSLITGSVTRYPAWSAGKCALLVLGRRDSGVLEATDVAGVATLLRAALGSHVLRRLRRIWCRVRHVADGDATGMLRLARAWCRVLLSAKDTSAAVVRRASRAVGRAIRALEDLPAGPSLPPPWDGERPDPGRVFDRRCPFPRREPPPELAAAARGLARRLADMEVARRVPVSRASLLPPGRLRMRGALEAAAQKAAGARPTALPWQRVTRTRPPAPLPRVGIALDISASMGAFFTPAVEAAWMCAMAARGAHGESAAVTFGAFLQPLFAPGRVPESLPVPGREWFTRFLDTAIDALTIALRLSAPGDGRILFLITDGGVGDEEFARVTGKVAALSRDGCAIVQIGPLDSIHIPGTALMPLESPQLLPDEITRAVIAAMRPA